MRDRLSGEPDALAEAFEREIAAAAREVGSFPERLVIRFPELREPLQARLEPRGVQVHVADTLASEPAARALIEHLTGRTQWPPASSADTWSAWRVPAAVIRALFAAAAECWRRAPWKIMDDEQTPEASFASGRTWTVGVMGNAGVEFGLALYSDPNDLSAIAAEADPRRAGQAIRGRVITLSYSPLSEINPAMRIEAQSSGWEIADRRAFPHLFTINTPGGGVTAAEVEELTALLRAIPEFAETHAEDLVLERRSGFPTVPLSWVSGDGLALRYDGEAAQERIAAAEASAGTIDSRLDIDPAHGRELRTIAEQVFEELGPDADAATFVRLVAERSQDLMARMAEVPQEEFAGLSPRQLGALIDADWAEKDQPMRLNQGLPLERLSGANLPMQCRRLLAYASEHGGMPATQSGYLATATVRELMDDFGGGPPAHPDGRPGRVIETDVTPLHVSRILLEIAGALVREKRRFVVTRLGKRLLREDAAGELFARLFTACFQHFDLSYLGGPEWPELQGEVAYTLYRLAQKGAEWATAEELLPEVVLATALGAAPGADLELLPALLLEMRVIRVLEEFGLMEIDPETSARRMGDERRFRATRLLHEFITFRV
jgi:hypothetical protein